MAMHSHQSAKAGQMSEFKQPSNAAAILGLSQIVFAKITGSTFVNQNGGQRIIIGLQLKNRNTVNENNTNSIRKSQQIICIS